MVKQHYKRLAIPRTWQLQRKGITFVTRPHPGAHPFTLGMSLSTLLKEILHLVKTSREVRVILSKGDVLVDGVVRKDPRHCVGFLDTISIPSIKSYYRITLSKRGKIIALPISLEETKKKISKIKGKTIVKNGKFQINTDDYNFLVDKDTYHTGDSLLLEIPSRKIKETLRLEKGALIMLTGGKHIGDQGVVEEIQGAKILFKTSQGTLSETLRTYALVLGKGKSVIHLSEAHSTP